MSNELTVHSGGGLMSLEPEQLQQELAAYATRRDIFRKWIMSQLIEGIHYGFPPGLTPKTKEIDGVTHYGIYAKGGYEWYPPTQWKPKKCLYKAGAQFLGDLLKLRAEFEFLPPIAPVAGGSITMMCKCRLFNAGDIMVAEGHGARTIGQKGGDVNNTVKMAEKNAFVGAILNFTGLSDLFTQDMEDQQQPNVPPDADPDAPKTDTRGGRVTVEDISRLVKRWQEQRGDMPEDEGKLQFSNWAFATGGVPKSKSFQLTGWTRNAINACHAALDAEEEQE